MTRRMKDKVALITGGGSGIGAATAKRFAQEGATVYISGRREELLKTVYEEIQQSGGICSYVVSDAGDEAEFAALIDRIVQQQSRLDVLVNNAASVTGGTLISDTSWEVWDGNMRVSLHGLFFGVKAAFPVMARQGGGAIVNVSSVCALLATPYSSAYSAAKAGVIGFSRTAAIEGAPHNIRVNVVIPGVVKTPGATSAFADEETERRTAVAVPLRRIGDPVELANAILFLASDEASYITGTELVVDGGKTCELNIGGANMEAVEI